MKSIISTVLLLLLFTASHSFGQSSPGSIQSSWDKAGDKKTAPSRPAPVRKAETKSAAPVPYPSWEKQRSATSIPWPRLPASPNAADYHTANGMLLDSLQSLYCLSAGYLRGLRAKNEHLYSSPGQDAGRQFQYKDKTPPPPPAKEGLASLFADLQTLLNNCLHGR